MFTGIDGILAAIDGGAVTPAPQMSAAMELVVEPARSVVGTGRRESGRTDAVLGVLGCACSL